MEHSDQPETEWAGPSERDADFLAQQQRFELLHEYYNQVVAEIHATLERIEDDGG
jgi:hypothetical protein